MTRLHHIKLGLPSCNPSYTGLPCPPIPAPPYQARPRAPTSTTTRGHAPSHRPHSLCSPARDVDPGGGGCSGCEHEPGNQRRRADLVERHRSRRRRCGLGSGEEGCGREEAAAAAAIASPGLSGGELCRTPTHLHQQLSAPDGSSQHPTPLQSCFSLSSFGGFNSRWVACEGNFIAAASSRGTNGPALFQLSREHVAFCKRHIEVEQVPFCNKYY